MKISSLGNRGVAMTVVIIIIIALSLVAAFSINFGYNKKRLVDIASGKNDIISNRAQAGLVDAITRIRLNVTTGLLPGGSFADPNYDPSEYLLDVDGNGVSGAANICTSGCDTKVDIGPVTNNLTGQRSINSKGCDDEKPIGLC